MEKVSAAKRKARRGRVRSGRPPKELAGEVEERILDAAREVFLDRGFEGASIEEIAEVARSGKPTIYARFQNKGALFAAVVTRTIQHRIGQFRADVPSEAPIEERLLSLAVSTLQWVLVSSHVGLLRLAIAEASRFPDLASRVAGMASQRGREVLGGMLAEVARSEGLGTLPAFAPERLATTSRFFLDLVLLPLFMRALLGEDLETLRAEIDQHAAYSVAFFLTAVRHSGID